MAMERKLGRSERNQLFRRVEKEGLEPADFVLGTFTGGGYTGPELRHKPSDSYFRFGSSKNAYAASWRPDEDSASAKEIATDWNEVIELVRAWLAFIRAEFVDPDLWDQFEMSSSLSQGGSSQTNEPFTVEERGEVAAGLQQVRRQLTSETELTPEQLEELDDRLRALEKATEKVGKRDWTMMLVGTLVNQAVRIGLESEQARRVFHAANEALRSVLEGGLPELPLG